MSNRYYSNVPRQGISRYAGGVSQSIQRERTCTEVAHIIRETRTRRGLSMTQLAEQAGLSRAMISFVESEVRNPTLETLLRICGALQVDLADVIRQAARRAEQKPPSAKK